MTRLHAIAGSVGILILLCGVVYAASGQLGITAVVGIIGLTASSAASGTLGSVLAGIQLRSEGHVHPGVSLTVSGPSGAITGTVQSVGPRLTVIRATDSLILLPNSLLTSNMIVLPAKPPNSVPVPPPPPMP